MRLPTIPGPSDVLAAVGGIRDGVSEALALVGRLGTVVGRVESLLDRVTTVMSRIEGLVDRAESTVADAEEAIGAVGRTRAKADDAIEAVGATITRSDGAVTQAAALVGRLEPLMADYEGPLQELAPSVRRLAETLEPHEIEAMVTLVDRLPGLVTHLDESVLPVLESLDNVGSDVHNLLDTMQDLRHIVKGFPGSRLFRRRGAEEIAGEIADDAQDDDAEGDHARSNGRAHPDRVVSADRAPASRTGRPDSGRRNGSGQAPEGAGA
ncbi:MAG TPA: hypothetical protein VHF92_16505 [Geodermatophilus sp.]|nr:hypothetical protein [Geodermatophilus sp.]